MAVEYSVQTCRELQQRFEQANLHRPFRTARYDPGTELTYEVQGFEQSAPVSVDLVVEKFIGGGFAGQVYKVKLKDIRGRDGAISGLEVGKTYAVKILIPPTTFSRLFRNMLYWIGFQGPFQQQVNPAAARAGSLWQKFIRRAAKLRFGDENAVVDVYGTFIDSQLGGCGEFREWVEGRTWLLEVDDRLDLLKRWRRGRAVDENLLGSAEYRAKRTFMAEFVKLLHEMGAHEFARQYEWSTCKSQPNCLKRSGTDDDPSAGLTAVDFRAGLTLLPFLPMSPGDIMLILRGIARGSLVQFDRGNLDRLEAFVGRNPDDFADMADMLAEIKDAERIYRDSVPDVTHNHVRLLYSGRLWSTIFDSAVTGWKVRTLIDAEAESRFRASKSRALLFFLVGWLPFLGKVIRRIWARADYRRHYANLLTSAGYFGRALYGKMAETIISWHRSGRIVSDRALALAQRPCAFFGHLPLSILPAGLHRFLTDAAFATQKLSYLLVRPIRLYFNAAFREQWLRDMLAEGRGKHMLSNDDAGTILLQINEPFIQKYLKSLAVHVCTLPVTQVVSVCIAIIYVLTHPDMPRAQAWGIGAGIIALFQVVPLSPGSLVRGLYVLYLVIRERNFKDYNIAVFLGFFKYVGYLAFPIQMTYRYPALARFMAAHWATEAAHVVPVFGERGALLEHWVFCLFYNWPLTIRRRMRRRAEKRAALAPRYWHVPLCAIAAAGAFALADHVHIWRTGELPGVRAIWYLALAVPLLCGEVVTLLCRGAPLGRRIIAAALAGLLTAAGYSAGSVLLALAHGAATGSLVGICVWRMFLLTILTAISAIVTELLLPEPGD